MADIRKNKKGKSEDNAKMVEKMVMTHGLFIDNTEKLKYLISVLLIKGMGCQIANVIHSLMKDCLF